MGMSASEAARLNAGAGSGLKLARCCQRKLRLQDRVVLSCSVQEYLAAQEALAKPSLNKPQILAAQTGVSRYDRI